MTADEMNEAYEHHTDLLIVERFAKLDPLATLAVLVASHAPYTWGHDAADSLKNAVALEAVAAMALVARQAIPHALLSKQMHRPRRIGFQLSAQTSHEHAQVMRLPDPLRAPDLFQKIPMRQDLALLLNETGEKLELDWRQVRFDAVDRHLSRIEINCQGAVLERRCPGFMVRSASVPKRRSDASQ